MQVARYITDHGSIIREVLDMYCYVSLVSCERIAVSPDHNMSVKAKIMNINMFFDAMIWDLVCLSS